MNLIFANLTWGLILGHIHAFDRLDAQLRLALFKHFWEGTDFTKPQDKALRSQGWITGPRHGASPNAQGEAMLFLATFANNGMADLQDDPAGVDYRRLLDPSGEADLLRRLATLHGVVAQAVPLTGNLPQRVELARTTVSWDWTGLPTAELTVQDLRLVRERGQHLLTWLGTMSKAPTLAAASDQLALPMPLAAKAILWLLQNLVLFLHFDPDQGRVHLGFHPERQGLASDALPQPQTDLVLPPGNNEFFHDLVAVLICAGEIPVSLLKSNAVSTKSIKLAVSRLGPAEPFPTLVPSTPEQRVYRSLPILRIVGLLERTGSELRPTVAARTWLALHPEDRVRPLAQAIRSRVTDSKNRAMHLDLWMTWLEYYCEERFLCEEVLHVLAELGPRPRRIGDWRKFVADRRLPEHFVYYQKHFSFQVDRLVNNVLLPTGLVRQDRSVIGFSPEGAWAFGLTDTWPEHKAATADVAQPLIVQADFTVIFLAPSAAAEIQVAPFCERLPGAAGSGMLYRLTKASVQRGASQKLTSAEMLKRLRLASSKPLPANVEREITGWAGSIKNATSQGYEVVTLPDEASADLLMGLARPKDKAVRLAPLLVGFDLNARLDTLITKAKAKGLIIDTLRNLGDNAKTGEADDDDGW